MMAVETTYNFTCPPLAPAANKFSSDVFEAWGYGGIAFLAVPPALSVPILLLYFEEVYYIMNNVKAKSLRNSILWILGTYPAIMTLGSLAVFLPRSVVNFSFMYGMYVAYATYRYYYLLISLCGGTKAFVERSRHKKVGLNLPPCCCIACLPKKYNSPRITAAAKWLIFQNVIFTPLCGSVATILKSENLLYSATAFSPALVLSAITTVITGLCLYGFFLVQKLAKTIEGMESRHSIRGKTVCFQLIILITGIEDIIFNALDAMGVFPCKKPFAFYSSSKVYYNYAVVIQTFFTALAARYYYRRRTNFLSERIRNNLSISSGLETSSTFAGVTISPSNASVQRHCHDFYRKVSDCSASDFSRV